MPGFGSRGGVRRPNAQLFQVHRLPEKDSCTPGLKKDEDLQQPEGLDDLHEWIDNILEQNDDISGLLEEPAAGQPVKNFPALPPALLEQASEWGAIDPNMPIAGVKPAAALSGRGAQIGAGLAVQAPHVPLPQMVAPAPPPPENKDAPGELQWFVHPECLVTEDGSGAPIDAPSMPSVAEYAVDVQLSPTFLYWPARKQWMWHRKWALPTISVAVRRTSTTPPANPPRALYVHLTAGTLPEGLEGLHDQGLVGECQHKIELDASGHGCVQFSRLLFKHTSYNVGARSFNLVATLLAEPAGGGEAVPMPHDAWCNGCAGCTSNDDATADAMDVSNPATRPPTPPGSQPAKLPMVCLRSEPIHVDARKRSKGERAGAADDDVRLRQRQHAGPTAAQAAAQKHATAQRTHHQAQAQAQALALAQQQAQAQQQAGQALAANVGFAGWLARAFGGQPQAASQAEAVIEIRADHCATIVNVLSAGAFGYSPTQLVGQPLLAIALPNEHRELMHAMQVLMRMDQIAQIMGGGLTPSGGPRQAVRVLHHILVGLGMAQTELVTADTVITIVDAPTPGEPAKLLMRSKQLVGPESVGPFRMLPVV